MNVWCVRVRYFWWASTAALCALVAAQRAAADIVVNSWHLECVVVPPVGDAGFAVFDAVHNPFHDSHTLNWAGATDSASYDVAFDVHAFDFTVTASVNSPGTTGSSFFQSICDGGIRIDSGASPLRLSATLDFAWNLPGGDRLAVGSVDVANSANFYFYTAGVASQPRAGDPPVGSYHTSTSSVILPPNDSYGLSYEFEIDSLGLANPAQLGMGNGTVHFHIEEVPEPCALALIAVGGLVIHGLSSFRRHVVQTFVG